MRRRGDVAGLPVVVVDSGKSVGRVRDGVFDLGRGRLKGLLVVCGAEELYLPFDQVHSLGATAVTVGADAVLLSVGDGLSAEAQPVPQGKRVMTREGEVLGVVDDVIFDAESGAVWGYQVTGGFISDFVDGKRNVPLTEEIIVGPDALVVPGIGSLRPVGGDEEPRADPARGGIAE